MSDEQWPTGEDGVVSGMSPEVEGLYRELRQMRSAIHAVVTRHEAIELELRRLGESHDDVANGLDDEDTVWLWTMLSDICPLCGAETDDQDRLSASSWELGVHEGNDIQLRQDAASDTTMTVRRRWTITTEIGRMESGQVFRFELPEEDNE
jgi:hypothetical protein